MPITEVASNATKSIAIVGSGSAGIAILKALLDLPEDVRQNWDIVLYEQRRNVGGVWLPDPNEPHPPKLPETPLYPLLHTNTPHPTMTYPGSPFRPGTPLFPSHEWVEQYHVDYAEQFGLYPYIHVNHTVHAAGWKGNSTHGQWLVEVHRSQVDGSKQVIRRSFDHLVVANGHNHYPRVPKFNGLEEWLANTPPGRPKREILHSIFYREPERYIGRTVLVIGGGASGRDAVLQVGPLTKTYHSLKEGVDPTPGANIILKPRIAYFNRTSIIFTDGSAVSDVDAIIAATGYKFLVPFLTRSPDDSAASAGLVTSPSTTSNCTTATTLISNERYIFPLWRHVFSISPQHPVTALSFVGLPVLIANCPSDRAQSLLISHAIANPSILEPRSELLADLVAQENRLRDRGYDPYYVGHKMVGGDDDAQEYQNLLVRYLKEKGALPDDGKDFVEKWRKIARKESFLLRCAWKRIEDAGEEDKWLAGIETEDEWADLILRLVDWQKKWEAEHGQTEVDLPPEELWDASGYY
ncbi:FAD/NAD(P)-binding domain-containing protein [Panus rudis PR-1116 ss-1]|nr:FAD/NAD(P)-binding domain-containing protein [Panus rudis PR-1116 ss-1]